MNAKIASVQTEPNQHSRPRTIRASQLAERLLEEDEIAVVDVRELARHVDDGHLLLSAPLPLSTLELRVSSLIPRKGTPIVVYDSGSDGYAELAAERLEAAGYDDVTILEDGVEGWRVEGLEVYTGLHALSKAFGEFVEHAYGTPRIQPEELKALLDNGEDVVLLDGRTVDEFYNFSIPGAQACPNAELPYRVHDLVPSDETLVVVSCAGRTRSIIGAQALINAGLPNRVVSLENGALAWLKAGYPLLNRHRNPAPPPSAKGLDKARKSAARLRQRFAIQSVDRLRLQALLGDQERTLYILDVRTRAEYEEGHLPQAVWAEGGQLVQATDQWIATRHARIVLIDDAHGVRSAITASWLIQLGWPAVFTYEINPATDALETGAGRRAVLGRARPVERVSVEALQQGLEANDIALFDFSPSPAYRAGHIPGARFALRSRIDQGLVEASAGRAIVVAAADAALADLAAADISRLTGGTVRVVNGGAAAWKESGLPLEDDAHAQWHDQPDDVWLSPYFREDRIAAFDTYIEWEVDLLQQVERDPTVSFRKPESPA